MKRTIKEVYDLIVEKRGNAEKSIYSNRMFRKDTERLIGKAVAYNDVLSLIEDSHWLEEDKPIKGSWLEALEKLWHSATNPYEYLLDDEPNNLVLKETIEKALKALEFIIENCGIEFEEQTTEFGLKLYCIIIDGNKIRILNSKKYYLLKEVFKWKMKSLKPTKKTMVGGGKKEH